MRHKRGRNRELNGGLTRGRKGVHTRRARRNAPVG